MDRQLKKLVARTVVVCLAIVAVVSAYRFLGIGNGSWEEEVLLHDGRKLIAKRSQTYRGRHEIGQSTPVGEHTIKFELPESGKSYRWTSEYREDLGRTEFNLLALHVLNGTPYLVTEPNLCLAYNKHGRPNPPYVIFKHDGKGWQQIQIGELPKEFETINLIVNNGLEDEIAELARQRGYVPEAGVRRMNVRLTQPEYSSIRRDAFPEDQMVRMCDVLVPYRGHWIQPDSQGGRAVIDGIIERQSK